MERSNHWNAEFYLIHSNSWNKWIFEINNHSNHSNRQVLLSFIFFAIMCLDRTTNSSHGTLHTMESSIRLEWVESAIAFISLPRVRKSLSKWLNSVDKWLTVVLLLSTLRITTATAKLSVDYGHGSQLVTISLIAAKGVHPWESPQRKL